MVQRYICFICQEEFNKDSAISTVITCGHVIHHDCLMQWFEKGRVECPVCRSRIDLRRADKRFGIVDKLYFHVDEEVSVNEGGGGGSAAAQAEVVVLKAELEDAHKRVTDLEGELRAGHERTQSLTQRLRESEGELRERERRVEALTAEARVMRQHSRTLQREAADAAHLRERVAALEANITRYRHCEEAIKAESGNIDQLVNTYKDRGEVGLQDLASQYRVQYRSYKECMVSRKKLKDKLRTIEQSQARMNSDLVKCKQELADAKRESSSKDQKIASLERALKAATTTSTTGRLNTTLQSNARKQSMMAVADEEGDDLIPYQPSLLNSSTSLFSRPSTSGHRTKIPLPTGSAGASNVDTTIVLRDTSSDDDDEGENSPLFAHHKRQRVVRFGKKSCARQIKPTNQTSSTSATSATGVTVRSGYDGLGGHCLEYVPSSSRTAAAAAPSVASKGAAAAAVKKKRRPVGVTPTAGVAAAIAAGNSRTTLSASFKPAAAAVTRPRQSAAAVARPLGDATNLPSLPSMDSVIELE